MKISLANKLRKFLRWRLSFMMLAVACVALGLEVENLRRRQLIFQASAEHHADGERIYRKQFGQFVSALEECKRELLQELSKPGSTEQNIDSWKDQIDTWAEAVSLSQDV